MKLGCILSQKTAVYRFHRIIRSFGLLFLFLSLITCSHKAERVKNAREFIREWNYDRALTEIIAFREDKDAEIQYLLGYCYLKKNEFDEAAAYFEMSLSITDTYKDSILTLYNTVAQNALRIDDPERALFFYQEIAKLIPEYDQANNLFLIGNLHLDKGNYRAALEAYRRALEIDSTSGRARKIRHNLIKALKESDSLHRALHLATEEYNALKTAANLLQLSEIEFALGSKLYTLGKIDSAKIFFEHIISNQEPKSLLDDAYFYMGEIYIKQGKYDAALEAYKKVLRLNPYEKGELVKQTKDRIKELKEKM